LLELLRERLYALGQGYDAQDDLDQLAHDPAFKMAVWDRPGEQVLEERLASQPTQSRLIDILTNFPDNRAALREALPAQPAEALPALAEVQPPWQPFNDPARVWLNSDCHPMGQADRQMDGTYFAAQASEYLGRPHGKPFFLMVSFYEPHSPFRFPLEYRDRHDAAQFSVPTSGPDDAK
jgi:hypothetical protein